jgi:AraC-like DNA-binding protein
MPGQLIRSAILDGAADLIRAHGARPAALARSVGLPRSALTDPDLLISANAVLRFFELAAQACRLPNWGLTLALGGRLAAIIGPLWVLLRNARTIGEMCTELAENFDLYSDAAMVRLARTPEGVLLEWSVSAGRIESEVQMAEFSLCIFANEIRSHLRPDWMPKAVLFRHARPPGRRTLYRTAFGEHVRFNQDRNALLLDDRTWESPLKPRGSAARALASRVVRLEEERPSGKRMALGVEAVVRSLMPYAPCTVDEVSRALDLPARTLQFRLRREGTSFTQVRDRVRADLASKYLRYSELSASRIAEILGYADVTSLSRSFRRWNGISLRQQRAQARRVQ